jgi:hypothetical protein
MTTTTKLSSFNLWNEILTSEEGFKAREGDALMMLHSRRPPK